MPVPDPVLELTVVEAQADQVGAVLESEKSYEKSRAEWYRVKQSKTKQSRENTDEKKQSRDKESCEKLHLWNWI